MEGDGAGGAFEEIGVTDCESNTALAIIFVNATEASVVSKNMKRYEKISPGADAGKTNELLVEKQYNAPS